MEAMTTKDWSSVEASAKSTTVHMMMWQGDRLINKYMQDYVKPRLDELYDIDLVVTDGQGNQVVNRLMAELEAGRKSTELDIIWINGETFYQLRQINALYGPFLESLPHGKLIDIENPFIAMDFQQAIDGYECPWGNVQMIMIYDSTRTANLPQTLEQWSTWIRDHPGRFTWSNDFTGMTMLKSWLIALADDPEIFHGEFSEEIYATYSTELWKYIDDIRPYLWNRGKSYPSSLAQLHQLFVNGEVDMTMSNNDSEVDNKISQGVFTPTTRAYVPQMGTIQNSHYLGIPRLADNKEGALQVINFLLSPEAQYEKSRPAVWGDGTVLDRRKLSAEWQEKWNLREQRRSSPPRELISEVALQEPAPEYMIRLYEDFRKLIIEK